MTEPNFNQAAEAYEANAVERWDHQDERTTRIEAGAEVATLDTVSQFLKANIEDALWKLGQFHYFDGKPNADAEELSRLIIDYIQDDIGHKAADLMRASVGGKK